MSGPFWQQRRVIPLSDEAPIRFTDLPDAAIQIVEAQRIDVAVVFTKGRIPIDLIGQAVPRHPA